MVLRICIRKVITTLVSVKSTYFPDLYPIPPWIAHDDDEDDGFALDGIEVGKFVDDPQ